MKTRFCFPTLVAIVGATVFGAVSPAAAEVSPAAATSSEQVQLSYGVEDVLKLVRAKVGEDVIVAFVQNSGRRYTLTASEIVFLQKEGATDRVITAMLNQNQRPPPAAP